MNVENTMCSGGGPNLQEMEGWKWSKRSTSQQSALYIWRLALSQNMHFGVATTSSILCMLAHDKICGKYICGSRTSQQVHPLERDLRLCLVPKNFNTVPIISNL